MKRHWLRFLCWLGLTQKAYIIDITSDSDTYDQIVGEIYAHSFPKFQDRIVAWTGKEFITYRIDEIMYGVNFATKRAVWNIYVIKLTYSNETN